MIVHQIYTLSPLKNYNYLVELDNDEVIAVDPLYSEQISKWCQDNKKKLSKIIITHEHPDHIHGLLELKKIAGARVYAHSKAQGLYEGVDEYIEEGFSFNLKEGALEVLYTPGHSISHICLLHIVKGKQKSIITMDTMFQAGVGHCKLPGANVAELYKSIQRLKDYLDDDVILYSGHSYLENNLNFTLSREPDNEDAKKLLSLVENQGGEYFQTTIGMEKKINTFLRVDTQEAFIELRRLRDNW